MLGIMVLVFLFVYALTQVQTVRVEQHSSSLTWRGALWLLFALADAVVVILILFGKMSL